MVWTKQATIIGPQGPPGTPGAQGPPGPQGDAGPPGTSYTDEQAQDAVGAMLVDTATIDLTYTDATPSITAAVVAGSIGTTQLTNSNVTYAKIQNVSATDRILGRSSAGAGVVEEIVCTPLARTLLDDTTQAAMQTTLGVPASSAVQPLDATLTALAGLATGANQLPYATGTDTFAQTLLTAFARTLLDDADAATMRGTLGLGTAAQQAYTEGTFTVTATGFTTTVTVTASYVQVGRQVVLMLPTMTGTSNATTTTLTGIPAGLAPVQAFNHAVRITDNATEAQGWISTAGGTTTWNVLRPAAAPWTASGTKTVSSFTMAYLVA